MTDISVTVSGSFHRYMDQIKEAVNEFNDQGVKVLSPADPRVVDSIGPFLFVASDQHRSVRLVQDRHLAAISQSDFLWLVNPDGYVGQSAALELGFAIAYGIPVFSDFMPPDLTLRQYILPVSGITKLLDEIKENGSLEKVINNKLEEKESIYSNSLLIDPESVIGLAHDKLETIEQTLRGYRRASKTDLSSDVLRELKELKKLLVVPGLQLK